MPIALLTFADPVSRLSCNAVTANFRPMGSSMLIELWEDECGAIDVTTSMLFFTMIVIGSVVGFSAVRTNLTQEFGDLSVALERLDQSYSYTVNGVTSTYSDTESLAENAPGTPPAGMDVAVAPSENSE